MPCMCWYEPSDDDKKFIKEHCKLIVDKVNELNRICDPWGCEIQDVHKLIDHLYSGKCDEK